eukprot:TRINITY_DN11809_c0_g1_i6.p1 TRINITY_DN11809_c0_g1~~TRINITY_DN11809_c0_g1_i6.p1  ORF type:complete len:623 (+),score=155.60 TRINITY_DN11809_c0_g1_i6:97-1965(+)
MAKRQRGGHGKTVPDLEEIKAVIDKRLFVGRVPAATELQDFQELFEHYGEPTECVLKRARGGANPGAYQVGFVAYNTWAECYRAIVEVDGKVCMQESKDGVALVVSFAEKQGCPKGAGEPFAKGSANSRIFVSGLPEDFTDEELGAMFSEFGNIQGANLLAPKRNRRCGFVNFEHWGEAMDAAETLDSSIFPPDAPEDGKHLLRVVLAEPRERDAPAVPEFVSGPANPPVAANKRRRMEAPNSDAGGHHLADPEFCRLRDQYFEALEAGSVRDCVRIHSALMKILTDSAAVPVGKPARNGAGSFAASEWPAGGAGSLKNPRMLARAEGATAAKTRLPIPKPVKVGDPSPLTRSAGRQRVKVEEEEEEQLEEPPASSRASHSNSSSGGSRPSKEPPVQQEGSTTGSRLYISGLPQTSSSDELRGLVEQLEFECDPADAEMTECRVVTGRGFGFLTFVSREAAEECLDALHERKVTGWPEILQARWSAPPKGGGKGGGGGGGDAPPRQGRARTPRGSADVGEGQTGRGRGADSHPDRSAEEVDEDRLFVGRLVPNFDAQMLAEHMEEYGEIAEEKFIEGKGVAYFTFKNAADARRACEALSGVEMPGVAGKDGLNVQFATTKRR